MGLFGLKRVIGPLYCRRKVLNKKLEISFDSNRLNDFLPLLLQLIRSIFNEYTADEGEYVNYDAVSSSLEYQLYRDKTELLESMDLKLLSENERKAFFLNLYNMLIIDSYIQQGEPRNLLSRMIQHSTVSYRIGRKAYTLNDIKHGILRGNRRSPLLGSSVPFKISDPRLEHIVPLDPRIHFAINCGAKSCPPLRFYNASELDVQLTAATEAAVSTLKINEVAKVVKMPRIFKWYRKDFGNSDFEVINWVKRYFSHDSRYHELYVVQQSPGFKIEYKRFNATANSVRNSSMECKPSDETLPNQCES